MQLPNANAGKVRPACWSIHMSRHQRVLWSIDSRKFRQLRDGEQRRWDYQSKRLYHHGNKQLSNVLIYLFLFFFSFIFFFVNFLVHMWLLDLYIVAIAMKLATDAGMLTWLVKKSIWHGLYLYNSDQNKKKNMSD